MRKQRVKFLSILSIIAILTVYYYPHRLDEPLLSSDQIIIIKTVPSCDNGKPELTSFSYKFLAKTDGYDTAIESLSKYSYHRHLNSLFMTNALKDVTNTYSIYIYKSCKLIHSITINTGEFKINGHSYKIGFWGKAKQIGLIDDIEVLLAGETPDLK